MICLEMIGYYQGTQTWPNGVFDLLYPDRSDFIAVGFGVGGFAARPIRMCCSGVAAALGRRGLFGGRGRPPLHFLEPARGPDPFGERKDPIDERIFPFDERIDPFEERIFPFDERIFPFIERIDPFEQGIFPIDEKIFPFIERIFLFVKRIVSTGKAAVSSMNRVLTAR